MKAAQGSQACHEASHLGTGPFGIEYAVGDYAVRDQGYGHKVRVHVLPGLQGQQNALPLLAHVEGFHNIPLDEIRERISEIEKGKPVYVMCQSGLRSYIACRILEADGYEAYNFAGGYRFYDAVMNDKALIEEAYDCGMDKSNDELS